MDALKRAGPHLSLPHDNDDDDNDEHPDSTYTLLLCARGEEKRVWPLLKKTRIQMPPLNTQELPLISAQFTNVGSGGP